MSTPTSPQSEALKDIASQPETRGIELIPHSERHGRPRALFWVWAAPSVSFLSLTMGSVMIAVLGLTLAQAFTVIGASAFASVFTGIIAAGGPAAGTSGSVISRAMYGVLGNRVVVGLYGWLLAAVYLSLTWSAASVNGLGLLERLGFAQTRALGVVVVLLVSALTVVVAVYGHALIIKIYPYISNGLVLVFAVAALFMAPHFDLGYTPAEPLSGLPLATAMTVGFTMLASGPISFINSPDMARYLPEETPAWRTAAATALGGALPSVVFTSIGALIATGAGVDMVSNPMGAFASGLPSWYFPIFTVAVIVSALALNGMTAYSASLSLQALGIPIRRIPSVLIIAGIGTVLTIVSVAVYDFTTSVSLLLQLVVVASAPLMAVFTTDVIMRRNNYSGAQLLDESSASTFWYRRGWNWAGLLSLLLGGLASSLCISTDVFVGPFSAATGLDLAVPAGMLVASGAYLLLSRTALVRHSA
ncbi:purine-cytosine permease family protein [Nocardiopsis salina]|uniref:purine-cytosine permease family protein n=1 Tax=Nocardiopsis salina TaxID=245836 RepID=UPI00034D2F4B|nr:cytosine permease [Nocardiopsis salina]